ncbi:hypothetical protein MNEG_14857 [Monoraphidium neglectum]|uniref:EGF-like domain-containing protein n=1 Tax=Monoraphidium neglectum TaxID=145388 RepID=A0A0D2MD09_9CHLO|nr:hypothetical protein MNEG_14857 [Monoraphidium neglectum]KIY93105.1 hypothetical protein MNEG_14857 [Monoraphidium neglectum]|eukprot:XP_013892125.1 hypothetical protein MNEG_14857 [Monoraphidium neglectum]
MCLLDIKGLWVQRVVQLRNGSGSVLAAPLAATVTVAVQVTTPDDMQDVVVEVMMPGGLEPLDPNIYPPEDAAATCGQSQDEQDLAGSSPDSAPPQQAVKFATRGPMAAPLRRRRLAEATARPFGSYRIWPPWPVCPAQETLPAVAGTHSIKFKAIAATPGTFVLPPVKAYVQKQPEIMGLSPGGKFTVCGARAAACDTAERPAAAAPKRCRDDCNGNGACNLATGVCICDAGFAGPTCAGLAASK